MRYFLIFSLIISTTAFGYSAFPSSYESNESLGTYDSATLSPSLNAGGTKGGISNGMPIINEKEPNNIAPVEKNGLFGMEALSSAFSLANQGKMEEAVLLYIDAVEGDDNLLEYDDGGLLSEGIKLLSQRVNLRGLESDMLILARIYAIKGDIESAKSLLDNIAGKNKRSSIATEARRRLVALRFFATL